MNLFSGDIDAIKLTDIDDFLALSRVEDERPPEGNRIDYKQSVPADVGDDVAALANSDGGLIFIGVRASKEKQNVPIARDGADLGMDAKARITDRILSTVQPRPVFEIVVIPLSSSSKAMAVIRVQSGPFPPYEFRSGATIRIPIRVQDTNRQATLREIEALQKKRDVMNAPAADTVNKYLGAGDLYCTRPTPTPPGETRENQFQLALVIPRVSTRIRLDSTVHREFERLIRLAFTGEAQFNRNRARGRFYQVEQRIFGARTLNRVWRIWADGTVGFVESLARRGSPGEWMGDVALDLLRFLKLATLCFDKWNCIGPVIVFHALACESTTFLPIFPIPSNPQGNHEIAGIHFPAAQPSPFVSQSNFYEETDVASLATPQELAAEIMLSQFQETLGASIRFDDLLFAVKRLFADTSLSNLQAN